GPARSDGEESVSAGAGDGGLLRPRHTVLRGELFGRSPRPWSGFPQEHFVCGLRGRTHGVRGRRVAREDEEGSGGVYGYVFAGMIVFEVTKFQVSVFKVSAVFFRPGLKFSQGGLRAIRSERRRDVLARRDFSATQQCPRAEALKLETLKL